MSSQRQSYTRRGTGFKRADSLLQGRIRDASAARGFAQSKLLTQWNEIVGPDTASIARPVEVTYARGGIGATLVLLTTGAQAPMLEMQKTQLRDKVNAVYGYNAISRIRITQTAPTGFSEGQAMFTPAPKDEGARAPDPATRQKAKAEVAPIADDGLRNALETLATNILSNRS